MHWTQEQYSPAEISGVLAATSICFDLSIFEIFTPLSWGGTAILVENAISLTNLPENTPISLINTVPSVLSQLLNVGSLPKSVQTINLAGEAFPATLLKQLQNIPHIQKIYNLYGPSEDTTYSTCASLHDTDCTDHRVPIGKPIANTQAYVLDRYQQPVPIGICGELYLGGQGLAQGYLNRPELTAKRFILKPFQSHQSTTTLTSPAAERSRSAPSLYRTGDRVRYRPDGSLEFLGRLDHQVKIRGFRIEIGEIEAALREQDAVKETVVIAHRSAESDIHQQLVAYIVPKQPDETDTFTVTLQHTLEQRLPAYLVPTQWVTLETLPRLPNGKLNRKGLPQPTVQSSAAYAAPQSTLQQKIADIWKTVLRQQQPIGIHDNFFELGGHSLLAIEIVAQVESSLQQRLPLKAVFQFPTVAGLAAHLEDANAVSAPENEALQPRAQIVPDPVSRHQPFPLTDIQRAYWVGRSQAFELGNIGTHGYREIDVQGLSVQQVEQALNTLINRHDMLRAIVNLDGQQQILSTVERYEIATTHLSAETAERQLAEMRDRLSHQVFTPQNWPLFHIEAAHLSNGAIRFFVSFDVLIGDAWSFQLLGKEIGQLIRGQQLKPLTLSFRDYVITEQDFQSTATYQQSLNYWQDRLETLPPAPELSLTMAPSQIKEPKFERRSGQLFPSQWSALKQRAHQAGLTPSGVLLAAFSEVLATWSKRKCFTLNLTLFNRLPLHPEVNSIVGDFTSSMLLAVDERGKESFISRAQRLQSQLWDDLEHRAVSGVRVLRERANLQNRGTAALMPVVFTSTLNQTIPAASPQDWKTETVFSVSQTSQVYLDHQVSEIDGELVFNWDAIADLFPPGVLDEMFEVYRQFLQQLADSEISWQRTPQLAPTDYLAAFNQTATVFSQADYLLHELFFQKMQKQPEHPAIITPALTLTYSDLASRVRKLAKKLRQIGLQPNQLVIVSIRKGWQQIVAVLGILTAGGAYVPIDPDMPTERRAHLVAETNAEIVLITEDVRIDWPAGLTQICVDTHTPLGIRTVSEADLDTKLERLQQQTDLAYVIYTSGSTGTPKGVMIDHRSVVNTLLDINQRFKVKSCDRILGVSSLSFDLSVYDIFGTLAAGATLVLPAAEQAQNPTHWRSLLTQYQITLWNSVPALMHLLVTELESAKTTELPESLRLVLLSGDWIPLSLPSQIQQHFPSAQTISLGGATEASIWSIYYPVDAVEHSWRSIPYGCPLANQQWYVLDENQAPCPPWVTGELYIGGAGLAKGYWNQSELTKQRFIPASDTLPALYKTGDLGRYLPSGDLEFLGREDFQVKINGYRIELGEIERVLVQYPAIESAVVKAVGSPAELVAYVVPKQLVEQAEQQALSQPLAKLDFKQKQLGIRRTQQEDEVVQLPAVANKSDDFLHRQSHRQFLTQPIKLANFSALLASLSAHTIDNAPLPKYRYASAGSLYPVQTYIQVKERRIKGLAAGWYYYHPSDHQLVKVAEQPDTDDRLKGLYGPNLSLHQGGAFSLFLVVEMKAIEPIYGEKARDFALIETGYMGQLMMEQAPKVALGLCPIGGFMPQALQELLGLSAHQTPLHALIGGGIDPNWNKQWMATVQPSKLSVVDTLKQHLSEKLPAYMVPTRYQILEQLPLTANGKVNRHALPQPDLSSATHYVAPTNPTEETIVQLWQTLLAAEKIGIHDNFFEVGGNSLIAMQLLSQLQNTFGVELTIAQLFGSLTPAKQAQLVKANDNINIDQLSDEAVDDMLQQLVGQSNQFTDGLIEEMSNSSQEVNP
ncbi:MAG: amino acid adenylation domain-containing protein [Cyanobacteria bacterium J06607_10]